LLVAFSCLSKIGLLKLCFCYCIVFKICSSVIQLFNCQLKKSFLFFLHQKSHASSMPDFSRRTLLREHCFLDALQGVFGTKRHKARSDILVSHMKVKVVWSCSFTRSVTSCFTAYSWIPYHPTLCIGFYQYWLICHVRKTILRICTICCIQVKFMQNKYKMDILNKILKFGYK